MEPLTEQEIRTAFVNCTKGEARRLSVPRDLADRPWDDLDYLGWRDPQAPDRAYLVAELDGRPKRPRPALPQPRPRQTRAQHVRDVPHHPPGGVRLMVAPKAGKAGQQGNSVGAYICTDLACSLYVRGKQGRGRRWPTARVAHPEEKIQRTVAQPRRVRRQGDGVSTVDRGPARG